MLQAAHTQLRQGVRLIAGVVETHGRAETEALKQKKQAAEQAQHPDSE